MNQLELHKKIDELIKSDPLTIKVDFARNLIYQNSDARQYFFHNADGHWLLWLKLNGFLDIIQSISETPTDSPITPEFEYLTNITEREQDKANVITDILLETRSVTELSEERIRRFIYDSLRIVELMPADQIVRLVPRIREEHWVKLMNKYNRWGFEYEEILKKLFDAKAYDSILLLAKELLSIKTEVSTERFSTDNPFYFEDLEGTGIFKYLTSLDAEYLEKSLALTVDVMKSIILTSPHEEVGEVFDITERFSLFDVDFFTLEIDEKSHRSYRDSVRNLAATIKVITEEIVKEKNESVDTEFIQHIYDSYIKTLPWSRSMWRLQLFVLSLCPKVFKNEIKEALFKIFRDDGKYHELTSGAEYYQLLKRCFFVLSEEDKKIYIQKVLSYFNRHTSDEKQDAWFKRDGLRILSCIYNFLEEKTAFGQEVKSEFNPEPAIVGGSYAQQIISKAPESSDNIQTITVAEIVDKLKSEWSPAGLNEVNKKSGSFHNPIDANGIMGRVKEDIPKRFSEYISNAQLFFDKDILDLHYTYSFLSEILIIVRDNKCSFKGVVWDNLINLLVNISNTDITGNNEANRDVYDSWLAGWGSIYGAVAELTEQLIGGKKENTYFDFSTYRADLLSVLSRLFKHKDPTPESDKESIMNKIGDDKRMYSAMDPFTTAINTVRGKTFQAFAQFIYQDGERFPKGQPSLDLDVKSLYKETLDAEQTMSIRFLFGHYLPSFYYRDKEWIKTEILPILFPLERNKKDLYLASWEGFLLSNLYKDIFVDFKDYYKQAIHINPEDYTKRKYYKDLDEGIATHLALAFIHFADFTQDSDLFKEFWASDNIQQHKEFVAFIGKSTISREKAKEWISSHKEINLEKLKSFWNWILEKEDEPAETFEGFGFWTNKDEDIFGDIAWFAQHMNRTLKKSHGNVEYDYGLMQMLGDLAEKEPKETLEILYSFLESENNFDMRSSRYFYVDGEIYQALDKIYSHEELKPGVENLINDLLTTKGRQFWLLENIVRKKSA